MPASRRDRGRRGAGTSWWRRSPQPSHAWPTRSAPEVGAGRRKRTAAAAGRTMRRSQRPTRSRHSPPLPLAPSAMFGDLGDDRCRDADRPRTRRNGAVQALWCRSLALSDGVARCGWRSTSMRPVAHQVTGEGSGTPMGRGYRKPRESMFSQVGTAAGYTDGSVLARRSLPFLRERAKFRG
jgi:hypothetical protein